jgi:RND family efflux transporter MFP subunit
MLAASDVATVRRDTIEAGTAITGNLRPIETLEVRARLEGDLTGVYVREGDRVSNGQLLARFEASEQASDRASAVAERVAAEGELATATWNLEQSAELFKAGAIAERDHRAAEQTVAAARARLAAAQARVRSTASFESDTRVLAPSSGIVDQRLVNSGERVARGAHMFTIVRNDLLELAASVPGRRASDIQTGQAVRFTADGRDFDGRVARVSPTIDPNTRAITVYVQVPNANGSLKGNTFATGRIIGRTLTDAVVIPLPAVRQGSDDAPSFVYRIVGDSIDRADVRLGVVDEAAGLAEVTAGLREGDRIVVGNVGTLGRGMRVQVVGGENAAPAPAPRG